MKRLDVLDKGKKVTEDKDGNLVLQVLVYVPEDQVNAVFTDKLVVGLEEG